MFINVQRKGKLAVYECDRATITEDREDTPGEATVEIESDKGAITLHLDKAECDVFLTNSRGETVNSWRWASNGYRKSA